MYRATNVEKIQTKKAEWVKTSQGRASVNASSARRRAKLKQLDCGCATTSELAVIWEYDHGRCYACGERGASYDHVRPLASGGKHCVANLRVACRSCNSRKNHRNLEYLVEVLMARGVRVSPYLDLPGVPCPKEES